MAEGEMAVRMRKIVETMTMMIWDDVENGHWCVILVSDSENHNEHDRES